MPRIARFESVLLRLVAVPGLELVDRRLSTPPAAAIGGALSLAGGAVPSITRAEEVGCA